MIGAVWGSGLLYYIRGARLGRAEELIAERPFIEEAAGRRGTAEETDSVMQGDMGTHPSHTFRKSNISDVYTLSKKTYRHSTSGVYTQNGRREKHYSRAHIHT